MATPADGGEARINLLILVAGLGIGGAEVVIQQLARTIDRRRFAVTLGCIKVRGPIGDQLAREGIEVVVLSDAAKGGVDYLTPFRLLKLLRHKRIRIVHTHTTDALLEAAFCKLFLPRLKLVHTFHFGNYPHLDRRHMWYERIGSWFANRLLAVGDTQRAQLRATYGFHPSRIDRVWNGVWLGPVLDGRRFRAAIGVTDQLLIGTIATMIDQKGLFDLMAVARRIRDEGHNARFVIVGEGHLRPRLETARRQLGLDDTVIFAGWVADASHTALPGFDIFFLPSLWEAMSIALLEAMAAARPVVATAVGEAPHVIEHGVDGLLVAPKDTEAMAAALGSLLRDPALRERLGRNAADKVKKQFTVERMTRDYEEIYDDVL